VNRRHFLTTAAAGAAAATPLTAQNYSDYSKDPRPDVTEGTLTAGSLDGPIFAGTPVVSGPAPDAVTILQPLQRSATGHLEYAVGDGPWVTVSGGDGGLLPLSEHVLKFHLPSLPPGKDIRYRVVGHSVGWVKVKQFYHGELKAGKPQTSQEHQFRTIDPAAEATTFAVWNDTHENAETLKSLHGVTKKLGPDFLLWNGDQSNDVHFEKDMAGQFLSPAGLSIPWPLAYVRGNHDVRGPAARSLSGFTGSPGDRFYYGFRCGPVAALVMDTGEDKEDASPYFGGMAAFERMQEEQAVWLKGVVTEAWFRDAPHKVLFCHIPLWFDHPKLKGNRFKGHQHARKLWEPLLVKAGVAVVISGHTHDYVWMPKKDGQPIAQLVGGAPQPKYATFIQGVATKKELKLKMTKLDGTVIAEETLPA
jgi:predicted phosphodiesterase